MDLSSQIVNFILIMFLALTHLFAYKLKSLGGPPRSIWLSLAGGITLGHVFMQLFPELQIGKDVIHTQWLLDLKHPIFLFIIIGLTSFYGVERYVEGERAEDGNITSKTFWTHIWLFAIYNMFLGYVISFERSGLQNRNQFIYLISFVLHFTVNDFGMQQKHENQYKSKGRWALAGSIILGWILAKFVTLSEEVVVLLTAFLAGAITFNMVKEELPSKRQSKFLPFLIGVVGISLLIIVWGP